MSFVLQPFNYFDSDPSENADDAIHITAAAAAGVPNAGGKLRYKRHGDLDRDLGDLVSRDVDCLPVMIRRSTAAATDNDGVVVMMMMMVVAVNAFWCRYS